MGVLVGPMLVAVGVAGAIWGVAVAIVVAVGFLLLLALVMVLFRSSDRAVKWSLPERPPAGEGELWRVLLVASQASTGPQLMREIRFRAREANSEFFVLCPVLDRPFEHWVGGSDTDREVAREFLHSLLDQLRASGVKADGSVGDNEPLVATEDALRLFPADEILIATHPLDKRGWLEHDIVTKIRARSELPITHVLPVISREAR
jgi:GABA permease